MEAVRLLWATVMASLWWTAGGWPSAVFGAIAGWALGAMMEPKLPKHYVSSKPVQWYASSAKQYTDRTWVSMEGIDPMNVYALKTGPLGDHARWWLKTQMKHDRRATRLWDPNPLPPPISTMTIERVEFEHEVAGWALAVYALWKATKVGRR